ncbi:MAG: T9SS type A sorting domain-containing protein [Roseivirga sp.]|nr:T9SS type A sorting domain-containing protein [Roseivirga sp.]
MMAFTKSLSSFFQNQSLFGWYRSIFRKSVIATFLMLGSLVSQATTHSGDESAAFAGPEVLGIALADYEPRLPNSLDFIVVFSKDVSGVDKSDFMVKATGDLEGAVVYNVSGGGAIYTVTVLNVVAYGDGSLGIELKDSGTDIKDSGGTPSPGFNGGEHYYLGAAFDIRERTSLDPVITYKLGYFPDHMQFSNDGKKMFVLQDHTIHEYVLQTPYSMSDVDYTGRVESFTMSDVELPKSFTFHEDGKKMIMHNSEGLYEYSFSTGFDVSTAVPDSRRKLRSNLLYINIADQVAFSQNGMKVYASRYNQYVLPETYQATLTAPFDVSSASDGVLVEQANHYQPEEPHRSMVFNPDGTRMIAVGFGDVNMFSMSSPHNAESLRYVDGISETALHTATSVAFNPAGTKMFVTSLFGSGIYEFDLDSAPLAIDISLSGTPASNASSVDFNVTFSEAVTGVGKADFRLDISEEIEGASITAVSGSGAEYVVTVENIPALSDGYVSIDLLKIAGSIKNENGVNLANNYKNAGYHYVGAAFDVSRAVYAGESESKTIESREDASRSIAFNLDGTAMFVVGKEHGDVLKYSLSKAYDVSTATAVSGGQRFSLGAQETNPRSLAFNHDGTRMYVLGPNGDDVSEYKLSTGYDLSTVSYQGDVESFLVRGEENDPTSLIFNNDGTKMFVLGTGNDAVQAYALAVAYDVSTADHTGSRPVGGKETNPYSLAFNLDGTKMYVMGTEGDDINEYTMAIPYDVVNSVYTGNNERFSVAGEDDKPRSLTFNDAGTKMFVLGSDNHKIHEYNLNSVRTTTAVSTDAAALVNAPFTATFTFSSAVTGFNKSDITVSNGTAGSFAAVSATVYTAKITPASDGLVEVSLAADVAVDEGNNGNSASNKISLDHDGTKPAFTSAGTVDFVENETGPVYQVTATDLNEVTFSLGTTGGDEGLFKLTNGVLTFKEVPDYETPKDQGADNIYKVKFRAFDGINLRTKTVSISVTNIDDTKPEFTSATQVNFVENGTGAAYIIEAIDESPLTYSMGTVVDSHLFSISGKAVSFKSAPDFETPMDADQDNVYQFRVIASDGINTKIHNVSVTVTDLNEVIPDLTDPVFTSPIAVDFAENGTGTAYTIVATDENPVSYKLGTLNDEPVFDLTSGALTFKTSPDFETPTDKNENNIYYIRVIASDGTNEVSQFVKITVTNVDDTAPVFTSGKAVEYEENGTETVYTALATDESSLTYSLGINFSEPLFEINNGLVNFKSPPDFENPLDGNENNIYYIEVIASDGINKKKQGVTITVTDVDDTAPVFTSATTTNFAENGAGVAYLATTTDENEVTYSLGNGHDEYLFTLFNIGGNQSIVLFNTSPDYENPLDLDSDNSYELEIIGSDGLNATSKMVSVIVTDMADTPAIFVLNLTYLENSTDPAYRATANSGNSIDYKLGTERDESLFNLEGEIITFKNVPDYEKPVDGNADNIYEIELIANDGGGDLSLLINIRIIDELEDTTAPDAPVVTGISDDTGSSSTDGVTNDRTLLIHGTAEANTTVEVFSPGGLIGTVQADDAGDWTLDIRGFNLPEMTTSASAEAIDASGNRSIRGDLFEITIDYTAPAKPAITHISDDTGSSATDGITSDRNILVYGTAEAGSSVDVFSPGGKIGTVLADANGDWVLDISRFNLPQFTANMTAEAIDLAGNRSATSDPFTLTIDFTAPAKPAITHISDDTGRSATDGVTSDRNILVHGKAEAGASVDVFSPGGKIGTVLADDANGDWMLDISRFNLPQFIANMTVEAFDLAGNRSITSDPFTLTIDFTGPGVTIDLAGSSVAGQQVNAVFSEAVSGLTLEEITIAGGIASDLKQISPTTYSFLVNSSGGAVDVSINANAAEDVAGNGSKVSNQLSLGFTEVSAREDFTDLQRLSRTEEISLYPNPVSKVLTIDLSELSAETVNIRIYNASGTPVFTQKAYREQILELDVSDYTSGIYIVQCYDGEQVIRKKVMVRK